MISNNRKDNGETRNVRSMPPGRSFIHEPFIPVMKIVSAFGIQEILRKNLTETE